MAYHSLEGRNVNPWIDHFKHQAQRGYKRREKDGLLLLSSKAHTTKDKHAIPIQNVSPIEQGVSQAKAELKEKKQLKRRAISHKAQSKKRRRASKTSSRLNKKKSTKKQKTKKPTNKRKKLKRKQSKDIFHRHGQPTRRKR